MAPAPRVHRYGARVVPACLGAVGPAPDERPGPSAFTHGAQRKVAAACDGRPHKNPAEVAPAGLTTVTGPGSHPATAVAGHFLGDTS
jgi:hypothetical protein